PIEYKKVPVPKPAPDKVLIKIKYTGVCHTDLHAWKGWPLRTKQHLIGGHEGAGVVITVGELVEDIKVVDHAGIKWLNGSCGHCEFAGFPCAKNLYSLDGSFQQFTIGKAAHIARIPKGAPSNAIAPILYAEITVYKALKKSNVQAGQTIAIVGGSGGLGSLVVQYAKAMSLRVIAIDTGSEKQEMCLNTLGAVEFVDFAKGDVVANVKSVAGGLGAYTVILFAVSEKSFQQAAEYCTARGTIVCVGLPQNAGVPAEVFSTVIRMITIKGSYVGNRLDTQEAINFFARCLIKAPFKVRMLSELTQVFQLLEECKIAGRYVLNTSVSSINHILGRFSDLTSPLI
ncbi:hypothetical protein B9Z19DRAFT_978392, partial [Tuber borchii]